VRHGGPSRAAPPPSFPVMKKVAATVTVLALTAAAIVAFAAMVHGAGEFEWNGFYPWVLAPYVLLASVFAVPARRADASLFAGCLAAVTVLLFTCWFYVGAMWFSTSSTSALIFIFAPVYLLVGGLAVWGVGWFVLARKSRANRPT